MDVTIRPLAPVHAVPATAPLPITTDFLALAALELDEAEYCRRLAARLPMSRSRRELTAAAHRHDANADALVDEYRKYTDPQSYFHGALRRAGA